MIDGSRLRRVLGDLDRRVIRESEPVCAGCRRKPDRIAAYVDAAGQAELSPTMYVVLHESTFNRKTNRFLCPEDYVRAGYPISDDGTPWICP